MNNKATEIEKGNFEDVDEDWVEEDGIDEIMNSQDSLSSLCALIHDLNVKDPVKLANAFLPSKVRLEKDFSLKKKTDTSQIRGLVKSVKMELEEKMLTENEKLMHKLSCIHEEILSQMELQREQNKTLHELSARLIVTTSEENKKIPDECKSSNATKEVCVEADKIKSENICNEMSKKKINAFIYCKNNGCKMRGRKTCPYKFCKACCKNKGGCKVHLC